MDNFPTAGIYILETTMPPGTTHPTPSYSSSLKKKEKKKKGEKCFCGQELRLNPQVIYKDQIK